MPIAIVFFSDFSCAFIHGKGLIVEGDRITASEKEHFHGQQKDSNISHCSLHTPFE